jgi:hypothetical protein
MAYRDRTPAAAPLYEFGDSEWGGKIWAAGNSGAIAAMELREPSLTRDGETEIIQIGIDLPTVIGIAGALEKIIAAERERIT